MPQLNDVIRNVVGGQINDGLVAHYQGQGASSSDLGTAEWEFLVAAGATPAHRHDMWYQLLRNAGYSGSLNDMLLTFWFNGGTFGPAQLPVFDPTNYPASFEMFEEVTFTLDVRQFFLGGGIPTEWALSGDVPVGMTISATGVLRYTPPFDDRDYGNITITGTNAAGSDSTTPVPGNTPENVRITFSPQDQFGEVGSSVTFACAATTATGFQWFRNGVPISGATSFAVTIPNLIQQNHGDEFFCRVEGIGGLTKDTNIATLTTMRTFNNLDDGSGQATRQVQVDNGSYNLSMSGSGRTTLAEVTADIGEI